MVNRIDNARLQRLESRVPGQAASPVIIRSIREIGEPIRAICGSDQLLPNKGENLADFERRAFKAFAQNLPAAVMLPDKNPQT